MRDYLEYYLVKSVLLFLNLFSNAFVYAFCKKLVLLFFKYEKRRRILTMRNIKLVYPDKSDEEVLKLAMDAYETVGITIAEILLMFNDKLDIDGMIENRTEALEKFDRYFSNKTIGKLMVTAHFSNWELLAQFVAKNNHPIKIIGREGNNHLIEENITKPFRQKYGNRNIYKKNAIVSFVKTLKQGLSVGILIDQKSGGASSVKANFFGREVDTISVIAQMKLRYNPIVLPVFIVRLDNGKYKILVQEPVTYVAEEELDEKQKIIKMTQQYNNIVEKIISDYPEQWFWMHDRWRIAK